MIRGIVQKFQTYSTGADGKFDVLIEAEDMPKAINYDKEKVYILKEEEMRIGADTRQINELYEYVDKVQSNLMLIMKTLKEMIEQQGKGHDTGTSDVGNPSEVSDEANNTGETLSEEAAPSQLKEEK